MTTDKHRKLAPWRERIHQVIFEADTKAGIIFDICLLIAIVISVVIICLETVHTEGEPEWREARLSAWRWFFTICFTVEYLLRVICVRRPLRYIFSFWGIVDLISFLPEYLFLFPRANIESRAFAVARSLRLLRVFRIFNLGWFESEALDLRNAIWRARAKIVVFLTTVMIIVTVCGTLMYEIENLYAPPISDPETGQLVLDDEGSPISSSQFISIPSGIYWAIVTMTTVGFGDIVPVTAAGKWLSALLILIGYSLIIVPTGFVSAEIVESRMRSKKVVLTNSCPSCLTEGHDADARFCKYCGEPM